MNSAGALDLDNGMRQFVAGTGGNGLYTVTPIAGEEAFQFAKHGVLALDLSANQYAWQFIATDGEVNRLDSPLHYLICPAALKVIVPRGSPPEV